MTMTVIRRCTDKRSETGGSCDKEIPCDGYIDSAGELHLGCGEPCRWVMRKEGHGSPPWRSREVEEAVDVALREAREKALRYRNAFAALCAVLDIPSWPLDWDRIRKQAEEKIAVLSKARASLDAAEPDGWRPKAGFDVGYGSLKEGDDCIVVAEGNMPSGPAKLLTVFHDGDAQIELRKVLTVKWRFLRPLPPPRAPHEGEAL